MAGPQLCVGQLQDRGLQETAEIVQAGLCLPAISQPQGQEKKPKEV